MHIKCVDKYNYDDLYSRLFAQYPNLVEIKAPYITDRSLDALKASSGSELRVVELETMNGEAITHASLISFVSQSPKLVSLMLLGDINCVTDYTIQAIANNCPRIEKLTLASKYVLTRLSVTNLSSLLHLRELDLLECPGFAHADLLTLVLRIPNIELLRIAVGTSVSDPSNCRLEVNNIFISIGACCPRLRVFQCRSHMSFDVYKDNTTLPLFAGCPLLEEFEVILQSPNDPVLCALGKHCPRLKRIEMNFNNQEVEYTDQGLITL